MALRWRGPLGLAESGYADESAAFIKMLAGAGHDVEVVELRRNGASEVVRAGRGVGEPAIDIVSCPWPTFELPRSRSYTVWRTMYETDRVPADWVARCLDVDEVWVPSEFNVETFARAGVPRDKLFTLRSPLDLSRFPRRRSATSPLEGFRFLSIFRWQQRKGWDILVEAFSAAFRNDHRVRLHIHTLPLRDGPFDPHSEIASVLGRGPSGTPPTIEISTDPLHAAGVAALYASADCFVLPSRGEGCGRPYLEAMASGLPTIGTRWSGNLAFMDDDTSMLIDARVVPVSDVAAAEWELFRGHLWAKPDVRHLIELLRCVRHTSAQEREQLGRRARERVILRHSVPVVQRELTAHLNRIQREIGG